MAGQFTSCAANTQFQAELDALSDGEELELHSFEYAGPVVIRKAITVDGHGATLWAMEGPVCVIESNNVTLKDLRIEVTNEDAANTDGEKGCALKVVGGRNVLFQNVEVRGAVQGLPVEEGQWRYPSSVRLNDLEYGCEHEFLLRLFVPVPCNISSGIQGMSVDPRVLTPGKNEVTLKVEVPIKDALLLGTLCLTTAFLKRQVSVTGRVVQAPPGGVIVGHADGTVLYEPPDWDQIGFATGPTEASIPVGKPSVKAVPPPPPVYPPTPTQQPPPPTRGADVAGKEGPAEAKTPASRVVRRETQLSDIFTKQAPRPVETNAGSFEPAGFKLPSVFGPRAEAQQGSETPSRGGVSGVEEPLPGVADVAPPGLSTKMSKRSPSSVFDAGPVAAPETQESPTRETEPSQEQTPAHSRRAVDPPKTAVPTRTQSIPISGIFGTPLREPEEPEKKRENADASGTTPDTGQEEQKPAKKKSSPLGRKRDVPPLFLE